MLRFPLLAPAGPGRHQADRHPAPGRPARGGEELPYGSADHLSEQLSALVRCFPMALTDDDIIGHHPGGRFGNVCYERE